MCTRTPVKIKRKPITVATKAGWCIGGWFAFPRPDEEPPKYHLKPNQRVLWCPWCDEWTIYKKDGQAGRWTCTGICGWGNTDEWHVKTQNGIWLEEVPTSALKTLNIPAPSKGRR